MASVSDYNKKKSEPRTRVRLPSRANPSGSRTTSGGSQVQGVTYSAAPAPYALQQSPAPQTQSPGNYSPIPYAMPRTGTASSVGGAPSAGAAVATAPSATATPSTSSMSLIDRARAGEFGDAFKNLALAQQQRSVDTPKTNIAVDNGTARDDEKKMQKEIEYKSTRGPLDLSYLEEAEQFAKKSMESGQRSDNAGFDRVRRQQEGEQAQETGTLSAGLARAGGYLGFTGSGEAVMLSLQKSHRAEMQDLESRRTQALSEARQAYNDQMYDIALEKQRLADEYEQQQYAEKQAYFDEVKRIQEEDKLAAEQERVNIEMYNALQNGAKDEMDVFGALKGKATPEQIKSFFDTFSPKTTDSDLFKPTSTQTAKLIGAGFGADDIQTIYDHLNENGYDDVLKASLTPYQRRVMDDMLTMEPEEATSGDGSTTGTEPTTPWEDYLNAAQEELRMSLNPNSDLYAELRAQWEQDFNSQSPEDQADFTPTEKKKLEQAGLLSATRQEQLDYLFGKGEEDGDIPEWLQ